MEFKDVQKLVYDEYVLNGYKEMWNNVTPKHAGDLAELGLVTSEVSEAMECVRNDDDKELQLELADIIIRVMNFATRHNMNLETAIMFKNIKNMEREALHGRKGI